MKIYKHEGKGHYIGSCVIVISESLEDANKLIRKELDSIGLSGEVLEVKEVLPNNGLIYSNNGDY